MMKTKRYELLMKISVVFLLTLYCTGGLNAQSVFWGDDGLSLWYIDYDEKIDKEFKRLKATMAKNKAKIKVADETNDLIERIRVRKIVIKRCKKAENLAEEYHRDDLKKKYRDYRHQVERDLPAIEEDIKDKKSEETQTQQENDNHKQGEEKRQEEEQEPNRQEQEKREQEARDHEEKERHNQEEERKRKDSRRMDQEKPAFEQEGGRYEHLRINLNKESISKADEGRSIFEQIKVREEALKQLKYLINTAPILIKIVNDWNNKWGAYHKVKGEHSWSVENLNKKMSEDLLYKDKIEQELLALEKRLEEESAKERQDQNKVSQESQKEPESIPEEGIEVDVQNDEIMSLKSVKIELSSGNIDFTLQNNKYKVLMKSNLNSIKDYVEKNNLGGIRKSSELPNIKDNKLPIIGLEEESDEVIELIVSHIMNILPIFRTMESIEKLISSHEEGIDMSLPITGWEMDQIKSKVKSKDWKKRHTYEETVDYKVRNEMQ